MLTDKELKIYSKDPIYKKKVNKEEKSLKKEWGREYKNNLEISKSAAARLSLDGKLIDRLEYALGYAELLKLMYKIGCTDFTFLYRVYEASKNIKKFKANVKKRRGK